MKNGPYILVKAPENYPGKRYRGKYCYEHILVYWQNTNTLPSENEQIHHKDGDKHNNVFSNLEKININEHKILHGEIMLSACVKFKCPWCGVIFLKEKRNSHLIKGGKYTACSRSCSGNISGLIRSNIDEFNLRISDNIVEEIKFKINKHSRVAQLVVAPDCPIMAASKSDLS